MNERIQQLISESLNKCYVQIEDAYSENDINKDEFREIEGQMQEVAKLVGLKTQFYPFKPH